MNSIPLVIDDFLKQITNKNFKLSAKDDPILHSDYVEKAVYLKRAGNYFDSIKLYIQIMVSTETVYSELVYFMFKVLACANYFKESILILNLGSKIMKQHTYSNPLQEYMALKTSRSINGYYLNGFEETYIKLMGLIIYETKEKTLEYLKSISGNNFYKFERDFLTAKLELNSILDESLKLDSIIRIKFTR